MPRGTAPPSQRNRPIGFHGSTGSYTLSIRPEELTRYEPSRLAVQQTLGGAWVDGFDRGITVIKISGTTGWHGGPADGNQLSGEAQFQQLRSQAFTAWHSARAAIVASGGDPSAVELYFVDTLNLQADLVAPKAFTLRRSKSRPLLMQYSIELLVLQDAAQPLPANSPIAAAGYLSGAASLGVTADALSNLTALLSGAFGGMP
jgi:hypothetical protein